MNSRNNFDRWNKVKQFIESDHRLVYTSSREIWWCSLGINIGAETNGKNNIFERSIIIMKVYNKETMLILPITSKQKSDKYHFEIRVGGQKFWVKLTQSRVISHKRLLRKIDILDDDQFNKLKEIWKRSL